MTTNVPRLGFIGFGEAAFEIAKGLKDEGIRDIRAYDKNACDPAMGALIAERAEKAQVDLVKSMPELVDGRDIVISAVVSGAAVSVAREAASALAPGQIYVDINSASPMVKKEAMEAVSPGGAEFVEVAVMAAVPSAGHRVPLLADGPGAERFARMMRPFGMSITVLGDKIGQASAVKMFRSIMVKGLEALFIEALVACKEYGVEEDLLSSLAQSFFGTDFRRLANHLMPRSAVHAERRAHEMEEVAGTLEGMGLEPVMARAVFQKLKWMASLGLKEQYGGRLPAGYAPVLASIKEKLGGEDK